MNQKHVPQPNLPASDLFNNWGGINLKLGPFSPVFSQPPPFTPTRSDPPTTQVIQQFYSFLYIINVYCICFKKI